MPLHHCATTLVSHLPCPPATKPVSHLTCPCHQTSQSFALPSSTASLHHRVSQSIALPPATKPVSHLPCPLPPNQSVICLAPCHQTSQSFDLPSTTASPHHRVTTSMHHCITASLHHYITASSWHHITASSQHCITISPCHHVSQSFALPPATKPVSHLTCPLPPHHCITTSPHHRIITSLHHHGTASPRQSVICLAPCHQTSQSFALPPATKPVSHLTCPLPLHHRITASLHHHGTPSPRHHITTWDFPHHMGMNLIG